MARNFDLGINPENLCPTGARLYKEAKARIAVRFLSPSDLRPLLRFYLRSVTDLSIQHINQSGQSLPLTLNEIERLIHEATQKERMILEDAVDKKILPSDDYILSQIIARFSVKIARSKNLKIHL
jgi:hypothetical protein